MIFSTAPTPSKASALNPSPDCGPQGRGSTAVAMTIGWLLYPWSPHFNSACRTHDQNYSLANRSTTMTQTRADRIFLADMKRSCRANWNKPGVGATGGKLWRALKAAVTTSTYRQEMIKWCYNHANTAYWAVAEFGSDIGAIEGFDSIKVTRATIKKVKNTWSDDEIDINFTVKNDGNVNIEVDAVMMKKGRYYKDLTKKNGLGDVASFLSTHTLDTEPDTYEKDLRVGQSYSDKLTTTGIWASQEDLGSYVYAYIRADLSSGFDALAPMARLKCRKPGRGQTKNCQIRYRSFKPNEPWVTKTRMEQIRSLR